MTSVNLNPALYPKLFPFLETCDFLEYISAAGIGPGKSTSEVVEATAAAASVPSAAAGASRTAETQLSSQSQAQLSDPGSYS